MPGREAAPCGRVAGPLAARSARGRVFLRARGRLRTPYALQRPVARYSGAGRELLGLELIAIPLGVVEVSERGVSAPFRDSALAFAGIALLRGLGALAVGRARLAGFGAAASASAARLGVPVRRRAGRRSLPRGLRRAARGLGIGQPRLGERLQAVRQRLAQALREPLEVLAGKLFPGTPALGAR